MNNVQRPKVDPYQMTFTQEIFAQSNERNFNWLKQLRLFILLHMHVHSTPTLPLVPIIVWSSSLYSCHSLGMSADKNPTREMVIVEVKNGGTCWLVCGELYQMFQFTINFHLEKRNPTHLDIKIIVFEGLDHEYPVRFLSVKKFIFRSCFWAFELIFFWKKHESFQPPPFYVIQTDARRRKQFLKITYQNIQTSYKSWMYLVFRSICRCQ